MKQGKMTTDPLAVRFDSQGVGVDFQAAAPGVFAYIPMVVGNLNPSWDAWLLDRTRDEPNWRQLPKLEGTAYAAVPGDTKWDLFLGHPVVADDKGLVIALCNLKPGHWRISLHNPTGEDITTNVRSTRNWTPFTLAQRSVTVKAGASIDIMLPE